jgi:hypothetical protein
MFNFSGSAGSVGQSDRGYANTPRVSWIHFAITSRKKQEKSTGYIFLKKCGMIALFLVTCLCHLLYLYPHIGFVEGSDLIGCSRLCV